MRPSAKCAASHRCGASGTSVHPSSTRSQQPGSELVAASCRRRDERLMAQSGSRLDRQVRALLLFVCALVLVDTMFFTALTPLLPYYTRTIGLSTSGAG